MNSLTANPKETRRTPPSVTSGRFCHLHSEELTLERMRRSVAGTRGGDRAVSGACGTRGSSQLHSRDTPRGSTTDRGSFLSRVPHWARGSRFSRNASPRVRDKLFANLPLDNREAGQGCRRAQAEPCPRSIAKGLFSKISESL